MLQEMNIPSKIKQKYLQVLISVVKFAEIMLEQMFLVKIVGCTVIVAYVCVFEQKLKSLECDHIL